LGYFSLWLHGPNSPMPSGVPSTLTGLFTVALLAPVGWWKREAFGFLVFDFVMYSGRWVFVVSLALRLMEFRPSNVVETFGV